MLCVMNMVLISEVFIVLGPVSTVCALCLSKIAKSLSDVSVCIFALAFALLAQLLNVAQFLV